MRIFAIAQSLRQRTRKRAMLGKRLAELPRHPSRHRRVIRSGLTIGRQCQSLAKRHRRGPVIGAHLVQQTGVIRRIGDHDNRSVILGGCPDHRRPADINILDTGGRIGTFGHGFLKRIKIDDQQINRLDPMRRHCQQMFVIIAQGQQRAMHVRVQRFHAPIHHFRKARYV